MTNSEKKKWDNIYRQQSSGIGSALSVLTENFFLLPDIGAALDLACGQGANAIFLAENGLYTDAWDISGVAIRQLQKYADLSGLKINAQERDINTKFLAKYSFDVIVIGYFLNRELCDGIISALKTGGLLFYQTYTLEKSSQQGPTNPDYLLAENELLTLFDPLRVVFYRENGVIGNCEEGFRNIAQFVGQKM